jgi:hypothetical protein
MEAIAAASQLKTTDTTRVRTDFGVVGSTAGIWKVEITDINLVPRQYLQPNRAVIEAAMKSSRIKGGAPTVNIPGVRFYQEQSLRIRR